MLTRLVAFAMIMTISTPVSAHGPTGHAHAKEQVPAAARGAEATVDAFHEALRKGDRAKALALLADDVLIYEAGGAERSKAEYARGHLAADSEFSRAVASTRTSRAGGAAGGLAWIASEGRVKGSFRGKPVDRTTSETILLRRVGRNWKIAHIHWSSAAAPAAPIAATGAPLLIGSTPAHGAVVQAPLDNLGLHFAPPARLLEVTVSGPDGLMPMMVTATGENAHYSLPLPGLGPGRYTVDWRASAGAREDKGTIAFTVR